MFATSCVVTYIFQLVVCICWTAVEVFIPYTENTIILYIQCVMKGHFAICFIHSDGFADCYHHILEVSLQCLCFLPFKCLPERVINVSTPFISSSFCSSSTAVLGHIPGTDCYRDLRCYTKVNQKTLCLKGATVRKFTKFFKVFLGDLPLHVDAIHPNSGLKGLCWCLMFRGKWH